MIKSSVAKNSFFCAFSLVLTCNDKIHMNWFEMKSFVSSFIRHRPSICRSVLSPVEIDDREKFGNQSGFISLKSCGGLLMALYGFPFHSLIA